MATYGDSSVIKQRSGVTSSDLANVANSAELDTLITNLNERASSMIEEYCGRDFEHHTNEIIEKDGNGRHRIRLPVHPITSINSIKKGGTALDAGDYRIKPPENPLGTSEGRNAGIIELNLKVFHQTGKWDQYEFDVDWGFQAVPDTVADVAEDLVVQALLNASQNESLKGVQSVSMDGFSVTLANRMSLNEEHKERLADFAPIHTA